MRTSLLLSILLIGCGSTEGSNPGECSDGADNDSDGLFDCGDSDCANAPDCTGGAGTVTGVPTGAATGATTGATTGTATGASTTTASGPLGSRVASELRFMAYFAWDSAANQIIDPVTIDGSTGLKSVSVIYLYEENWTSDDPGSYCLIQMELAGHTAIPDPASTGFLWGLDLPQGTAVTFDDCLSKGFDSAHYNLDSDVGDWTAEAYHIRMGGGLSYGLEDWLTPTTPSASFDIRHYEGGDWWIDTDAMRAEADVNYFIGFAMDGSGNVDSGTRLLTPFADSSGDLATGYYIFDQRTYWILTPPATTPTTTTTMAPTGGSTP